MSGVLLILVGLALGSFTNALVWRLYQQSVGMGKDKKASLSIIKGRSMCVYCKHTLAWYDLLPVLSWLQLKGKCRYCLKSISIQYPLVELTMVVLFVVSYYAWPTILTDGANTILQASIFIAWLGIVVLLVALSIYDLRWMLLPNRMVYPLGILVGALVITQSLILGAFSPVVDAALGFFVVGGFFWLLYQLSGGKWIGGGDVRLSFIMGILLGWQQGVLAVLIASYIGTVIVIVLMLVRKYHKGLRIPFGPLLAIGTYVSFLWGRQLIDWYLQISGF